MPHTRQLYDDGWFFTEFSRWLRLQEELDSIREGLDIENLDYIIHKYNNRNICKFMLIEEKRFMKDLPFTQRDTFSILDSVLRRLDGVIVSTARGDKLFKYFGFHLIQFEKTCPDDGRIFLDKREISKHDLIRFLRFEAPDNWYVSYFDKIITTNTSKPPPQNR